MAALLAALMLPSAAALAQDDYEELPLPLERGVYLQVAGLAAFETFGSTEFGATSGKNTGGFSVRAGLRTSKWSSVEAQFEWIAGMDTTRQLSGDWFAISWRASAHDAIHGCER